MTQSPLPDRDEVLRVLEPFAAFEETLREWRHGGRFWPLQEEWPKHTPVLRRTRPLDDDTMQWRDVYRRDFEAAKSLRDRLAEQPVPKPVDYTGMDGPTMLRALGDDAWKWAAAFRQTALKLGYSDMDEGWLIGWFANAIEHSTQVRTPPPGAGPLGLETTAEDRASWHQRADDAGRLARDFDRLLSSVPQEREAVATNKPSPEHGWLVESEDAEGAPIFFTLAYDECSSAGDGWTKDSLKALRFSRREDADAYASLYLDSDGPPCRVTEHMWLEHLTPANPSTPPETPDA